MDLIERQKAIDAVFKDDRNTTIKQRLEALPTIEPERKKGKWIDNETSYADGVRQTCTCSVCGQRSVRPLGRFCRWCGADMREETK